MAVQTPRFSWQNFCQIGAAVVTSSSARSGTPVRWVKDQLRSKSWKSKTGWNISKYFNENIDFQESSTKRLAFVASGTYASGSAFATQVATAVNAAGVDPATLSPTAWFRADSLPATIANGGVISQWSDVSGNNRHLTQATGSKQPTLRFGVLNERPVVRFDGTDDGFDSSVALSAILGANGRGTVFAVYKIDVDASGLDVIWADTTTKAALYVDNTTPTLNALNDDGTQDVANRTTTRGVFHIGIWMQDGTNVSAGHDNANTAGLGQTASGNTSSLAGNMNVGYLANTNFLKGDIAEIIIFNSALSEENRRRVEKYLVNKYGTTDSSTAPAWNNTYTCTYDTSTNKFTITRSAGADSVSLLFNSGTFKDFDCTKELGFNTGADKTSATTYTSDNAVYCSREYIHFDLGTAMAVTAGIVLQHNFTTNGTVKLQGQATTMTFTGALASGSTSQTLVGDSTIRILFFSTQTYRYWRLVIDDTGNSAGYVEVGAPFIGAYTEFSNGFSVELGFRREQLSNVTFADQGAHFFDQRQERRSWSVTLPMITETEKANLEQIISYVRKGRNFFVSLDPASDTKKTYFVFLPQDVDFGHVATANGSYWNATFALSEALG